MIHINTQKSVFLRLQIHYIPNCTKYFTNMMMSSNGNITALLAICAGNSPVTGEFPTQRPVTRSFDVSFGLRLNKRLSKQSWGWWFQTLSHPLWRHCNNTCHGLFQDDSHLYKFHNENIRPTWQPFLCFSTTSSPIQPKSMPKFI